MPDVGNASTVDFKVVIVGATESAVQHQLNAKSNDGWSLVYMFQLADNTLLIVFSRKKA